MGQGKPIIGTMILSCTAMGLFSTKNLMRSNTLIIPIDSSLTLAPLYPYPNYSVGVLTTIGGVSS